jgi:hypothetical protein
MEKEGLLAHPHQTFGRSSDRHLAYMKLDALKAMSCGQVFEEKASGAQRNRPELKAALEICVTDNVLVPAAITGSAWANQTARWSR